MKNYNNLLINYQHTNHLLSYSAGGYKNTFSLDNSVSDMSASFEDEDDDDFDDDDEEVKKKKVPFFMFMLPMES